MRSILLAGLGRTGRPYVKAARDAGYEVAVVDDQISLSSQRTSSLLGPSVPRRSVAGWSAGEWYSAIRTLIDETTAGIVPFTEVQVVAVALLAEEFGFPTAGTAAVSISQLKSVQRSVLEGAAIPQPQFYIAPTIALGLEYSDGRYPVVAKPVDRSGSSGVKLVANETELVEWHSSAGITGEYLIEEFVAFPEYSVEAVVVEGNVEIVCITEKITTPLPYFVEVAHVAPAHLEDSETNALTALAQQVVAAAMVGTSLLHLEVRGAGSDWRVIEFALRTPGDHILELHAIATGINLFRETVRAMAGEQIEAPVPTRSGVAVAWFPEAPPGIVTDIAGVDLVLANPAVSDVRVDVALGGLVKPLRSSDDRPATIIFRVDQREDLDPVLKTLTKDFKISTTNEPAEGI